MRKGRGGESGPYFFSKTKKSELDGARVRHLCVEYTTEEWTVVSCPCRAKPEREAASYDELQNTSLVVPWLPKVHTHTHKCEICRVYSMLFSYVCRVYRCTGTSFACVRRLNASSRLHLFIEKADRCR